MSHLLSMFARVRIINLVDRADRRREVAAQMSRIGGIDGTHVAFFAAHRPTDPGPFPSLGARGCFESHLQVLREARDAGARSLLLIEDDLDFTNDAPARGAALLAELDGRDWSFFYGAHREPAAGRRGLVEMRPDEAIVTAAFLGFAGPVIGPLVDFLEAMEQRPAGSPDYGPMHVDGAYSVYRMLHPELRTFAAFPPLGRQRASRSDITATAMILDRFALTRPIGNAMRRVRDRLRG